MNNEDTHENEDGQTYFHKVPDEVVKQLREMLSGILDPTAGLDERKKGEIDLATLIHNSIDHNDLLQAVVDESRNADEEAPKDDARLFAAAVMAELEYNNLIEFDHRIMMGYAMQIITTYFRIFDRYKRGEEI